MFDSTVVHRWTPRRLRLYRWLDAGKTYDPASPWSTLARFGDGSYLTIYLAESADGAMAEFFRRRPTWLELQDNLAISLFQIEIDVLVPCLDVRDAAGQAAAGITRERLTSSEAEESVRYLECRALAHDARAASLQGIGYPSAAAAWDTWNLVLFDEPSVTGWQPIETVRVPIPRLLASDVVPIG